MSTRFVRVWTGSDDPIALAPGERVDRMDITDGHALMVISQTPTRAVADRAAAILSEGLRRLAVRLGIEGAQGGEL